ncbi:MAG: 5-formyltetrahydrofolate cyclo-ligase [Pseudomonadota bacterium]|nr:MAG: 5-formyltetrahydrofolate cyclo-ligase [Pseudomonadota bacterium]
MTTGDESGLPAWDRWRRAQRPRLIAARKALQPDDRRDRDRNIDHWLATGFGPVSGRTVGFCWPFAAEPEPRFAIRRWRAGGSRAALPVVQAARRPLLFREWWPGVAMARGVYNIPYPIDTGPVTPEVMLVPVNGFDAGGYRLGYGGAYFDRTLVAMRARPICIGLGYETARLESIDPQPHDIPFDFIVTEAGIERREGGRLHPVTPSQAEQFLVAHGMVDRTPV